ncbi:hypothetical protein F4780DRAFT_784839 [Xylariomycetidae sp. FL0641]|nr:hypothetical protein F4780DRAFT_784839 [Xylariomycetidae sp. FL0641]
MKATPKRKTKIQEALMTTVVSAGSSDPETAHIEDVKSETTEKRSRITRNKRVLVIRRHCVRFWLGYLIGSIIFLAIFLPLLFLKIVPALAQLIVDKTPLSIYGGSIKAINNTRLLMGLQTALNLPAGLKVKLDPIELYLYNKETPDFSPFTTISIPEQWLEGKTAINIGEQPVAITNTSQFEGFLARALNQATLDISARGGGGGGGGGVTTAHLGAPSAGIELDKTITIPALRKLAGVAVADGRADIVLPPAAADGANLQRPTLNLWSGGRAGPSPTPPAPPRGNSTLPFRGPRLRRRRWWTTSSASWPARPERLAVGLGITGNTTQVDGVRIGYLGNVLNAASLYTEVPVTKLFEDGLLSLLEGNASVSGILGSILGGGGGKRNAMADMLRDFKSTEKNTRDLRDALVSIGR